MHEPDPQEPHDPPKLPSSRARVLDHARDDRADIDPESEAYQALYEAVRQAAQVYHRDDGVDGQALIQADPAFRERLLAEAGWEPGCDADQMIDEILAGTEHNWICLIIDTIVSMLRCGITGSRPGR